MQEIPAEAAAALRPVLAGLADEIIVAIANEVPEYSRALEGNFGQGVRQGVEVALGRFLDDLENPGRATAGRETYVGLGRGEVHAGRSLDALLGAYRVGARVAWRRFVDAGVAHGLEPEVIYRLGEAIFEYIDELSAESAEGYADEQMAQAGERRRRRAWLIGLLAGDPPPPEEEVRAAARDAGWELPRVVAALVVDPGGDDLADFSERLAREIGLGTVAASFDGAACALVSDPEAPGRRRTLDVATAGRAAGLGPAVPWQRTGASIRRAQSALRLAAAEGAGLVVAEEQLAALLLAADAPLAADLAERALAPLADLPAGSAARLRETLRAWLDRPGQVKAIAEDLGVHPQTVRYRVRRLRELFGDRLDDPERRFELALALRAGEATRALAASA